ncbi:MAG: hypothetical protein Q4C78_00015 [Synergistaceae bacterium]|nr:hypothetical protein [Synergistaceae bacterium]
MEEKMRYEKPTVTKVVVDFNEAIVASVCIMVMPPACLTTSSS